MRSERPSRGRGVPKAEVCGARGGPIQIEDIRCGGLCKGVLKCDYGSFRGHVYRRVSGAAKIQAVGKRDRDDSKNGHCPLRAFLC